VPSRLDSELVRRGLARSRRHALDLVAAGQVIVDGKRARRGAAPVTADSSISATLEPDAAAAAPVATHRPGDVSRGAVKLRGALGRFAADGLEVGGRRCLDAGASTGGFTQVLLEAGADRVVAVDVGRGQLAEAVRHDPRVDVHEATNVRDLTPELIDGPVDLVVADLSFISLTLVLPALAGCAAPDGDLVLLVKPQFEVGRERVGSSGVVRSPADRLGAVTSVAAAAERLGLGVAGATASSLPGPTGNVEYFLWLHPGASRLDVGDLQTIVEAGPR
jgi:23S rRNA (cytidine1920-2'-O)/16S rRNA (cytidine1409-2'-O)-methyltransferase